MRTGTMSYDEACERAATDQGLDPICDVLRGAGIPHTVDQTGGFTMCVNVPLVEGGTQYLYLTSEDDLVLIGRYWDCLPVYCDGCGDIPDSEYGTVTLDKVVAYVRAEVARKVPCPYCHPDGYAEACTSAQNRL